MTFGPRNRILVADDEPADRDAVAAFLGKRGFEVRSPDSDEEVLRLLTARECDLLLLDLTVPKWELLDPKTVVRELNEETGLPAIPVIMMSGGAGQLDRIEFLEAGADDFITKPLPPLQWRDTELAVRIGAVLRRVRERGGPDDRGGAVYGFEGWSLDPARRELRDPDGVLIGLTEGEFRLLLALLREPGTVLAREELLGPGDASDRSIDVHVSRLRSKLERGPDAPQFIKTVRGGGYIFVVPVEQP